MQHLLSFGKSLQFGLDRIGIVCSRSKFKKEKGTDFAITQASAGTEQSESPWQNQDLGVEESFIAKKLEGIQGKVANRKGGP